MKPRLLTSKKWTQFPLELNDQIKGVFVEAFQEKLGTNTQFLIEGRIYPEEICLRVGYIESGRITQSNFEVSMDVKTHDESTLEKIHLCVDAAASMLLEHLENIDKEEGSDLPISWTPYKFSGQTLFLQYSTENSTLEAEANRLLGLDEKNLVYEDETFATEIEAEAAFLAAHSSCQRNESSSNDTISSDDDTLH